MHSIGLKINQGFFSNMIKTENIQASVKSTSMQSTELTPVNTTQSSADNSTLSDNTEQPGSAHQGEHLYGFFAIGLIINVVLLIAFFIWAYRQWNKKGNNSE